MLSRFRTTTLLFLLGICLSPVASAVEYTSLPVNSSEALALQTRLLKLEELLAQSGDYQRYILLDTAARAAMQLKQFNKASSYASELLNLASRYSTDWNYASALHHSRIILGLIAVHDDDIDTAKRYLLAAGNAPASDILNQNRPDFELAQALLDKGEKQTVIRYLTMTRKLWPDGIALIENWLQRLDKNDTVRLIPDASDG